MTLTLDLVRTVFSRINLICAIIGAALLFGIATIVCMEVIGRALGASSQLWVIEASEYALIFITFLGAPYLLELNRHVVMDLLTSDLTGERKRISNLFNGAIGLIVCMILTIIGMQVVLNQFDLGTREVTVMRPLSWWITSAMPLGTGLMAVQFLDVVLRNLRSKGS
ncbi:TRAP transporter small permease subunit [Rhodobacterales bacterium LSUCC0246]|nr:TRAP transporter small permease subunit [Rhodobacterales bacterium LSUCC0374]